MTCAHGDISHSRVEEGELQKHGLARLGEPGTRRERTDAASPARLSAFDSVWRACKDNSRVESPAQRTALPAVSACQGLAKGEYDVPIANRRLLGSGYWTDRSWLASNKAVRSKRSMNSMPRVRPLALRRASVR